MIARPAEMFYKENTEHLENLWLKKSYNKAIDFARNLDHMPLIAV